MIYKAYLSQSLTLKLLEPAIQSVLDNEADFEIVFALMTDENDKVAWRSAWLCEKISERRAALFKTTHFSSLISLSINTKNESMRRLALSMLTKLKFTSDIPVDLLNACYEWISSDKYPVAVQALSLGMLYQFCTIEPALKPELLAYLEDQDTIVLSAGMKSVRRNVMKKLIVR
ncbi:MAG: hypothetical protein JXR27_02545 [Paludibacteraceae bacterium]|nr:hypothetical protein [Paludibacteraceae bacterium]